MRPGKIIAILVSLLCSAANAQNLVPIEPARTQRSTESFWTSTYEPGTTQYDQDMLAHGWNPRVHPQTGETYWSNMNSDGIVTVQPREASRQSPEQLKSAGFTQRQNADGSTVWVRPVCDSTQSGSIQTQKPDS